MPARQRAPLLEAVDEVIERLLSAPRRSKRPGLVHRDSEGGGVTEVCPQTGFALEGGEQFPKTVCKLLRSPLDRAVQSLPIVTGTAEDQERQQVLEDGRIFGDLGFAKVEIRDMRRAVVTAVKNVELRT